MFPITTTPIKHHIHAPCILSTLKNTQYTSINTQKYMSISFSISHLVLEAFGTKGQREETTSRQHLIGISPGHKLGDTFSSPPHCAKYRNTQMHKYTNTQIQIHKYTHTNANTKHLLRISRGHKLGDTYNLRSVSWYNRAQ